MSAAQTTADAGRTVGVNLPDLLKVAERLRDNSHKARERAIGAGRSHGMVSLRSDKALELAMFVLAAAKGAN